MGNLRQPLFLSDMTIVSGGGDYLGSGLLIDFCVVGFRVVHAYSLLHWWDDPVHRVGAACVRDSEAVYPTKECW